MTLQVELSHRIGAFALDVSFAAPDGVTALFGRSGSGKTTIVNAVAGLVRPDRGRIVVGGQVLTDSAGGLLVPAHRRRLGYVFQEGRLFPHLSVRGNLTYGRWFAPRGATGPTLELVADLLGLGALLDRRPGSLSGGEKQRVAIGRAILSAPRMLLMDEPLAALDADRKAEILPYLERLRDDLHLPILYVSHSAAEVARLATTVVVIDAGRLLRVGPAAQVLADPGVALSLPGREAGALLAAVVEGHEADGLTRLALAAGPVWLPRLTVAPGTALRLRIQAADVMLALVRPLGLSALNILPATVRAILPDEGAGAMVQVQAGADLILARVTQRSVALMRLAPGVPLYVVLKAISVAPKNVG